MNKIRKRLLAWQMSVILVLAAVLAAGCSPWPVGTKQSQTEQTQAQQERAEQKQTESGQREAGEEKSQTASGEGKAESPAEEPPQEAPEEASVTEDGLYILKDEVALYLHTYGHLPANYISKKEAQELGWDSKKGNLDEVAPGKSIGGSHFGNYEGMLPEKKGRKYYECDLEYEGGYRGAKRLIYSNDGLIFYTEDHYKTFEQLY